MTPDSPTKISMADGSGGSQMQAFIAKFIVSRFTSSQAEIGLAALDDGAVINDIVISTDGHTVHPIFFPGGDIGSLSVAGTINDVAMMGASPIALTLSLIIEEGFSVSELDQILDSMAVACDSAVVPIITGDTKIMEHGAIDKLVITTTGIGTRHPPLEHNLKVIRETHPYPQRWITDTGAHEDDIIIVSGTIGDHGIAIMSAREGLSFSTKILSDVAPLHTLTSKILSVGGITAMKDPTRGGLANTLNEWSSKNNLQIRIDESSIPIAPGVRAASDMLGIDPINIGNEGKLVLSCIPSQADLILKELRTHPLGKNAARIGVVEGKGRDVILNTVVGGSRLILPPVGDPIPRIC